MLKKKEDDLLHATVQKMMLIGYGLKNLKYRCNG
jgi:hypothetical protein